MYVPPHFREKRQDVLHDAMRRIGFATLVTRERDGGIEANHLPLLLEANVLSGHFARANPVWKNLGPDADALAIFLGPHFYVSPNWYPSKVATGKAVPTWNYIAVHARGKITLHDDPLWLGAHVSRLAQEHERAKATPWSVDQAPADYISGLLRAIVGFELSIETLEGKWKLSQNRERADIQGVKDALTQQGRDDLAQLMKP